MSAKQMSIGATTILGYQIRVLASSVTALWTQERRQKYLLDPEVRTPLSVDTEVWPTMDDSALGYTLLADFDEAPYSAPNALSLYQLKSDSIGSVIAPNGGYQIVGIGVESDIAVQLRKTKFIIDPTTTAALHGNDLVLLGYDVCDEGLISGLMNCALESRDKLEMRNRYAQRLNPHGLISDFEVAKKFANDADLYVPEHAAFFPVGLFVPRGWAE
jgi:hypothetical protein